MHREQSTASGKPQIDVAVQELVHAVPPSALGLAELEGQATRNASGHRKITLYLASNSEGICAP